MEDGHNARWALSQSEMARIAELSSVDELVATWQDTDADQLPVGDAWSVVVLRDGSVTDRTWDGTTGVPGEIRDIVGDHDTLYHPDASDPDGFEETLSWVDVVVRGDGSFLRFADEPSASPAP